MQWPIYQFSQSMMCGPLSSVPKIAGWLVRHNQKCISEIHDMKILSFGVTQHFTDEVDWILDLAVGVRPPPLPAQQ
jgi:hypothetical protein